MATAQDALRVARSQLGYREERDGSSKYGRWYGMPKAPWCDMFVSWVAWKAGAGKIIGKSAYTPAHATWFKKRKQWGSRPRIGSVIFFKLPDGPNRINHVGFVERIESGGTVVTIEGNTSNAVLRRRRSTNIVGYGYPAYAPSPGQPPGGLACAVSGWLFAQRGPSLWVYRPTKLPVGGPFAGKAREVSKGWGAISRIFSGGNGVLYAIDTAGKLRWYRWTGTTFAKGAGTEIGSGWGGFTHVFSGGDGVVYAVTKDGKLLWYRHANPLGAVQKWVVGSGKTIGTGWDAFTHIFPGGQGVIYAVNKAGELRWYRNANPITGVGWVKGSGKKIGTGWNTLTCTSAGGGVIYAINKAGELRWYRNANPITGTGWIKGSGKKIGAGWTGMTPTADLTTCRYV